MKYKQTLFILYLCITIQQLYKNKHDTLKVVLLISMVGFIIAYNLIWLSKSGFIKAGLSGKDMNKLEDKIM